MMIPVRRYTTIARLVDERFDIGEEVLDECEKFSTKSVMKLSTLSVVSKFRTSPDIRDSEKSTLAFHNCVRKARRI